MLGLVAARKGAWTWLECQPRNCLRCANGQGCGAALLGRQSAQLLKTPTRQHYRLGKTVPLPDVSQPLVTLAAGAYGAPLVGLLIGMMLGAWLALTLGISLGFSDLARDMTIVLVGLAGLWCGARGYRRLASRKLNQHGDCPL